ncbi:DUF1176 domain-containing protein [Rhizobiaceae bacterium BDR2-2]|uniref:DUF1176 domain-containing protein n=1 Tax=Ectorhizobium quercum TaxID=2965071 RepID=A0AAE3MXV0_9HYPH|nr:DUF1176 domain-containing protein [Ectorhizobium quercum]MCX8996044.1 DUF1176 domain-containing protein [Ectorhizobium quercum]
MRPITPAGIAAVLSCWAVPITGGAQAQVDGWQAGAIEKAQALHRESLPEDCTPEEEMAAAGDARIAYPLWFGEDGAARDALLVQFLCSEGAYNRSFVYVLVDQYGVASPVFFPSPVVEVRYAGGDPEAAVEGITITGTVDSRQVVNARYDPDSRTMEEYNKWRGLADAYSLTRWGFRDGRFQIMHFAVDASYDGKDNPQVLIERDIW